MAKTLKILSEENAVQEFYNGTLTDLMVKEIKKRNGIIEKEDFANYT